MCATVGQNIAAGAREDDRIAVAFVLFASDLRQLKVHQAIVAYIRDQIRAAMREHIQGLRGQRYGDCLWSGPRLARVASRSR